MSVVKDTFFGGAEKKAGRAQQEAAYAGVAEQQRQYDLSREDFAPIREAGLGALSQQQALLGLSGAEDQQQAFQAFAESPGQQFLREQQEKTLLRNQAAIGGLGGGNVRRALTELGTGLAAQDYGNYFNRLGGISGSGQNATSNIAQLGSAASSAIQQGLQNAGTARASGLVQGAAGLRGGIAQLAGGISGGMTGGMTGALQGGFGV